MALKIGHSSITKACTKTNYKKNNIAGNFIWTYVSVKKHTNKKYKKKLPKRIIRKINQFSKKGKLLKKWDGIAKAANKLNIDRSSITRSCKGIKMTAGGFIWKYADEQPTQDL